MTNFNKLQQMLKKFDLMVENVSQDQPSGVVARYKQVYTAFKASVNIIRQKNAEIDRLKAEVRHLNETVKRYKSGKTSATTKIKRQQLMAKQLTRFVEFVEKEDSTIIKDFVKFGGAE